MGVRAERARETGRRIIAAVRELIFDRGLYFEELTLREVAAMANVSEQTVIRRFGSKEGLVEALVQTMRPEIEGAREFAEVGAVRKAVRIVVDEYERLGDGTLRALAQEERVPPAARAVAIGRASHRRWCARTFAPYLPPPQDPDYDRRLTLFVTATDVYTWKLHRRDAGLDRAGTERSMVELVEALVDYYREEERSHE